MRKSIAAIAVALALAGCSRSEEHTSELQSRSDLVCRLLLEKKKKIGRVDAPNFKVVGDDQERDGVGLTLVAVTRAAASWLVRAVCPMTVRRCDACTVTTLMTSTVSCLWRYSLHYT